LENLPPALWQTEEEVATESDTEVDPELLQWTDGLPVRTPRLLRGHDPPDAQASAELAPPTWDLASKKQATVLPRNGTCEVVPLSEDCIVSNCTGGCEIGLCSESTNGTVDSFLFASVPGHTEPDVLKVQPQGPRRRLETLATQGSALLRITQEELDSISQVTFKCEQYFGAATRTGGGVSSDDGAHLFSTVAEFIADFRTVWDEVHRHERWAKHLPGRSLVRKDGRRVPLSARCNTTPFR
jgi:hypothetical protein